MSIAYFDCFSGVAGDMVLGALIDAGMPLPHLKKQLKLLSLRGYELRLKKTHHGISGSNINVIVKKEPHHDDYKSLDRMIARSRLPKSAKTISRVIFEKLARAEAKVHCTDLDRVHFHEVGAVDSVVDVVGAAIGLDFFGFDAVYSSPIPMSRGKVRCAHGIMPVPAPATLEILKGIPLEKSNIKQEIVTPTGAAILASVVENFGECPLQKIEKIGYGFGDRKIPGVINAVRIMIGEGFPVVVVQANIDDMNPQIYDYVIDLFFKAGAVDVDLSPIQMKKNRPAVKLSVLVPWDKKEKIIDIFLKETTTFGVRYYPVDRKVLVRELVEKKTALGKVRFKLGLGPDGSIIKAVPEYEDVKRLALKTKQPLAGILNKMGTFPGL